MAGSNEVGPNESMVGEMVRNERKVDDERDDVINQLLDIVDRQFKQLERLMTRDKERNVRPTIDGKMSCERFQRLGPPRFEGNISDPESAEEWIRTLEGMFDFAKIEDEEKVSCAVYMLAKDARFWWDTMKTTHCVPEMTWSRFKEVFYDKYFNATTRTNKLVEFMQLRQTGSVADYIRKFESLSRFATHLVSIDKHKVHQFVQGLKVEIYRGVKISGTHDVPYSKVVAKALEIEDAEIQLKQRKPTRKFFKEIKLQLKEEWNQNSGSFKRPFKDGKQQGKEKRFQGELSGAKTNVEPSQGNQCQRCQRCKKYHVGNCMVDTRQCFRCKEYGHIARYCPTMNGEKKVTPRIFALIEPVSANQPTVISGDDLNAEFIDQER